jgi:hypothetical protein
MFVNNALYTTNFLSRKSTTALQPDGFQPEFGNLVLSLNMHMRRFISITGIEKDAIWTRSKYSWHGCNRSLPKSLCRQ